MTGIFLISARSFGYLKRITVEQGVWFAVFGAIGMGTANFLFGIGSRATNPLIINWFVDTFIAVICLGYLIFTSQTQEIKTGLKNNVRLILMVGFLDKVAWIG
jgi:hypothetical protein